MRRPKKPVKIPPSEDDLWLDMLHTECGKAMAQWLKAGVNLERQVKTLSIVEFRGMAAACEATWIKMVVTRLQSGSSPLTAEETEAYRRLCFGA